MILITGAGVIVTPKFPLDPFWHASNGVTEMFPLALAHCTVMLDVPCPLITVPPDTDQLYPVAPVTPFTL